jgi:hypothetical protein
MRNPIIGQQSTGCNHKPIKGGVPETEIIQMGRSRKRVSHPRSSSPLVDASQHLQLECSCNTPQITGLTTWIFLWWVKNLAH